MSGARFTIIDLRTNRQLDVEAIHPRRRTEFGDSLRERCEGSISEAETRITPVTHSKIRYSGNPHDGLD